MIGPEVLMTNRAKYWQRMVVAWEASGLSQAEFCRRRGLKAVTFAWWKRQLVGTPGRGGARRKTRAGRRKPAFVEVALPDGVTAGKIAKVSDTVGSPLDGYEVALPCGTSIRLPADFDVDKASQLISAVAQSC
jgi:hypothetical protein